MRTLVSSVAAVLMTALPALAQPAPRSFDSAMAAEKELESIAIIDRKLMIPMRDGIRLSTDVYRPKNATGPVPIVFEKTPYNFNWWDVRNRMPGRLNAILDAVKRGYAYVVQNERGHFFSEGNWDILGPPTTDGYDMFEWLAKQPWSNQKVGTIGCSSTAEWQMAVASLDHPAHAAVIAQGFGAGVGRVGPWFEQGNWFRGGAVQMLFTTWLYGEQNQIRPTFPPNTSQEDLIRASKAFDLGAQLPNVDWDQALAHLPEQDIMKAVDGPHGIFADSMPVPTGGRMIQRTPNDPAWYQGGLYHDDMPWNKPAMWFMSWYDVSVGPNLAMFNHALKNGKSELARKNQYAVIAPVGHCGYTRATENTIVGERSMGDARYDYSALTWGWFDNFLKGEKTGLLDTLPRVRYYTMGINKWQKADSWPPAGATPVTYYLSGEGRANSLSGDGKLLLTLPKTAARDTFTYDPMHPVPTHGGNVCCNGNSVKPGSWDQKEMEARRDILVYSTDPLTDGVEVSGPVSVTLYVTSDAKDTDFTVKLLDVYPDGRAFNLDETIQRMRYRNGYDKPLVWMTPNAVTKVALGPLNTSNYFEKGHRVRIEVSSSNFPRFDRNLNTGGNNYDESSGVIARNSVNHSKQYPSQVTLTVIQKP